MVRNFVDIDHISLCWVLMGSRKELFHAPWFSRMLFVREISAVRSSCRLGGRLSLCVHAGVRRLWLTKSNHT